MRILAVIAGLLAGLLLQSAPASAHGAGHATRAVVPAQEAQDIQPAKAMPAGVCEIDLARLEAFVTAKVDHSAPQHGYAHDGAAEHDASEHNPADHSHAFGEDGDHQLMSHGGHDVAAQAEPEIARDQTLARSCAVSVDDGPSGILVAPPVPPPLG